jgi:DeoR/GlpR family transcriptional regulator of sugar metabolism
MPIGKHNADPRLYDGADVAQGSGWDRWRAMGSRRGRPVEQAKLKKKGRHELILRQIAERASIRVSLLAEQLGVTGETIRRDIAELNASGLLSRTYGGATLRPVTSEASLAIRQNVRVAERDRIGGAAAGLVADGAVVMIDGGSTTYQVIRHLAQRARDLTIVTNSTSIAAVATSNPGFRVRLCPGSYDGPEALVTGEETIEYLARFNAHHAIIGASGLGHNGPCDVSAGQAAVKRAMLRQSERSVLVVDASKFGVSAVERVCGFDAIDDLVVDRPLPAELARIVQAGRTRIHVGREPADPA